MNKRREIYNLQPNLHHHLEFVSHVDLKIQNFYFKNLSRGSAISPGSWSLHGKFLKLHKTHLWFCLGEETFWFLDWRASSRVLTKPRTIFQSMQ